MKKCNLKNEKRCAIHDVRTRFLCDSCGKEKSGKKHKMYDENWNLQRVCYKCDDCFGSRLDAQITDDERNVC